MVSGGVDNMEKYKYMLGQAHAYQYISGEISNLLNKGANEWKRQRRQSRRHWKRQKSQSIKTLWQEKYEKENKETTSKRS